MRKDVLPGSNLLQAAELLKQSRQHYFFMHKSIAIAHFESNVLALRDFVTVHHLYLVNSNNVARQEIYCRYQSVN